MSKVTLSLSTLAATALLSSCAAFTPEYREPSIPVPVAFASKDETTAAQASPTDGWWEAFGDAALDQLIATALTRNGDLRAGIARLQAARARRGVAESGYLPAGSLGAGYERRELSQHDGGQGSDGFRTGFDAAWELDLFGRVSSAVRAADARVGLATADLDDLRLSLGAEVGRTYFEWRGAQRRLQALSAFHDDQVTIVEVTAARVENGMSGEDDLRRAQAQLATDRAALLAEKDREQRIRHTLAALIGEMPTGWHGPSEETLQPLALRRVAIGDPAAMLRHRPDVRAAERRLAAATAEIGVATADLFPQVRISGFLGYAAGSASDLGSSGTGNWLLAPSVSWGVFDLGRVRANIRAEKAEAAAALAAYEQTVLRALAEAESAFGGYGLAHARLAALIDQTAQSRRAAELARVRYEEGESDYLSTLDAARNLRIAEAALADGLVQQRLATIAVHKALGVMPAPAGTALAGRLR